MLEHFRSVFDGNDVTSQNAWYEFHKEIFLDNDQTDVFVYIKLNNIDEFIILKYEISSTYSHLNH